MEVEERSETIFADYVLHQVVYCTDKSSSTLRVDFNGSYITSSEESLNSIQSNGGVIQDDLLTIILRFRTHCYAFTTYVKTMCRMTLTDKNQCDLKRIVGKDSVND